MRPADEKPQDLGALASTWDDEPCGLLHLDGAGLVTAANRRLLTLLGYTRTEVVGLMSWDGLLSVASRMFWQTQLAPVLQLNGTLDEVMVDLHDADGRRVPALLNATRVIDVGDGSESTRIAVMHVPDRRAYENELREARLTAEESQAADGRTRLRLELLARASVALASSVEIRVALARLAQVLVGGLADWCLIYTADPDVPDARPTWAAAHTDPDDQTTLERLAGLLPLHATAQSKFAQILSGGAPVLVERVTLEHLGASTDSAEVVELCVRLGVGSAIIAPGMARGSRIANVLLVRRPDRPAFSAEDLEDLIDLGARTGIAIDTLRQRAREHNNSVALQQALLTAPPAVRGVEIVTRYLPATTGNEVGGDWYDAFLQTDGTPVFVIGDVVGHDIRAAAAMGQLRGVMRTLGYPSDVCAADILSDTDSTARGLGVDVLASVFVARLRRDGRQLVLDWSNAGHPPPVVMTAAGDVRQLVAEPDPILGLPQHQKRHGHSEQLAPGDVVLMYTDGLVERLGENIDDGIRRLAERLASGRALSTDALCDLMLEEHQAGRRDDIALLAVRVLSGV